MGKTATKPLAGRHLRRLAAAEAAQATPAANGVRDAAMPDGFVQLIWHQIEPDPENPRKDFQSEGAEQALDELAASIERDGLLENLVVRQAEPPNDYVRIKRGDEVLPFHRLIAGERRWRAIGRLIERGAWPAERPIMCKLVEAEAADHRRIALIENLQRRDLKPLEEARALQALAELTGASAAQLGRDLGFTERWAQQRLSLLKLPSDMQGRMETGELTIEEAREAAALLPKLPEIKQIELQKGKITVAAAKQWLANRPEAIELTPEEELVFLEAALLISRKGKQGYTSAPCDYRWQDGITASLVNDKRVLSFSRDYSTGHTTVSLQYAGQRTLEALIATDWILDKAKILPLVRRAQTRALGNPLAGDDMNAVAKQVDELEKSKRFLTKWLNTPHEINPEFKAEAARRAQQIADQEARQKTWEDERQARQARLAAAAPRALQFAKDVDAADTAQIAQVLEDLEAKVPWRWHTTASGHPMLVDAEGREVELTRWRAPDGLLPLVMALVNAATGHPAFFDEAGEDGPAGEEDDDDQVDQEDAPGPDAEDDDVELTPALQRLAGVHTDVAAEAAE